MLQSVDLLRGDMKIKTDINIDHYYRLQALAAQGHKFSFNDFVNHMIWNYIMYCICTDDMVPPPELVVPHNPKAERKNITIDIESYPHMMFKKYCEQRSISMTTCVKILTTIYSY